MSFLYISLSVCDFPTLFGPTSKVNFPSDIELPDFVEIDDIFITSLFSINFDVWSIAA